MLKKEDWMDIKTQIAIGVYQKDISRQLGVHPKTISWYGRNSYDRVNVLR